MGGGPATQKVGFSYPLATFWIRLASILPTKPTQGVFDSSFLETV